MFGSNVQPRKRMRPKGRPWFCDCNMTKTGGLGIWRPGYLARCNDCGKERPS